MAAASYLLKNRNQLKIKTDLQLFSSFSISLYFYSLYSFKEIILTNLFFTIFEDKHKPLI